MINTILLFFILVGLAVFYHDGALKESPVLRKILATIIIVEFAFLIIMFILVVVAIFFPYLNYFNSLK